MPRVCPPQHTFHEDTSWHSAVRVIATDFRAVHFQWNWCRVSSTGCDRRSRRWGSSPALSVPHFGDNEAYSGCSHAGSGWGGRHKGFIHLLCTATKRQIHQITAEWIKGQRKNSDQATLKTPRAAWSERGAATLLKSACRNVYPIIRCIYI